MCGGKNITQKEWRDCNTGELQSVILGDNTIWCDDCAAYVELLSFEEFATANNDYKALIFDENGNFNGDSIYGNSETEIKNAILELLNLHANGYSCEIWKKEDSSFGVGHAIFKKTND